MPKGAEMRFARLACLVAMLVAAGASLADTRTLYRWTDSQGRVQYSDRPPAAFKGEVTRVEVELDRAPAAPPPAPAARPPLVAPEVLRDVVPPPTDINKARRQTREKHEAAVRQAEQKVAAARAALDDREGPQEGEGQVIQRKYARPLAGRSNCRAVADATGRTVFNCPGLVPSDEYYERIRGLEEELKKAEEELAAARAAYRRAVD